MKTKKFKLKLLPIFTIPGISIVVMSCMKTSTIKSKEHAKEITYLISTIKTNKKVEIVNYKSDSKNNLIITLKNKSNDNINANSLAIFKEGSKTGELIREKLNGLETKTFHLKTKINTKRKNILYIFEKQ
ncbi:hypothetical protein [Borreliella tanukii]|uniref:hypothetical protein n=1 Tax=Borreliella tanukii TaxID=56146 RepID=UPI002649102F|nr:hypothetical protein [Borreliella tanukii]WKC79859.1 hypothetical protein QIA28_02910 [Borreliella tanukii]WKC80777.1 hypothetical protein QIA29_02895 [Borreliella tanukii]WKC81694.1 hypothetical protein QIA27_02895 [Borreliella tanukii]WKC82611.1 hypothetical protein QIA26_02890 [Borreliella tanukii]